MSSIPFRSEIKFDYHVVLWVGLVFPSIFTYFFFPATQHIKYALFGSHLVLGIIFFFSFVRKSIRKGDYPVFRNRSENSLAEEKLNGEIEK